MHDPVFEGDLIAADSDVKSIEIRAAEEGGIMSTLFLWLAFALIFYMIYRYSDTIAAHLKRMLSSNPEDDEMLALKLSGGDEEEGESIKEKIKDFAKASKNKIKKTLTKGQEALSAAAESVQNAAADAGYSRGR